MDTKKIAGKSKWLYLLLIPFVLTALVIVGFIVHFLVFSFTYVSPQEEIIASIGEYECIGYYSNGGFQDYTDYAVYDYNEPDIENAERFERVNETAELNEYLNNFEKWVSACAEDSDLKMNYNFDRSIIDKNDYFCIRDKASEDSSYTAFNDYDIYVFDSQTEQLYYFHNNI